MFLSSFPTVSTAGGIFYFQNPRILEITKSSFPKSSDFVKDAHATKHWQATNSIDAILWIPIAFQYLPVVFPYN